MKYIQVALPVPLRKCFDYISPVPIARGTRVQVPFGRKTLIGIVMGQSETSVLPAHQLKNIEHVCDDYPLFPEELCQFIEKAARYYHYPIGEVAFTGTPLGLRQDKPLPEISGQPPHQCLEGLTLNEAQQIAFEAITEKDAFNCFLLEGITGSGKTEVYLQAAAHYLKQGKQVLILVPEISLTPQTVQRFTERFGEVICYHSRLTPKKRLQAWLTIRHQQSAIVIGTRSAIFLPFTHLGLIVIDEEHDPSFKQQEGFRYGARDMGVLRAKLSDCPIVLGSATPAFESILNAQKNKYQSFSLPTRATQSKLSNITLLDIRHNKLEGGLSAALIHEVKKTIDAGKQALLFINRRGFSPTFMCYRCHWMAQCQRCDARLTYHQKAKALVCHHCLAQRAQPSQCPTCQSAELHPVGQGTQRLESVLQAHFPEIEMARIDSDVIRKKGQLESILSRTINNEIPLLIGTQILAKGHHFPHLHLVGIIDADGGLFSADFRAVERMAQLLIQVSGRAGRVLEAGEVFIQTCHPEHPLLRQILTQNYHKFAEDLLKERQHCHLPPFSHFALIRASALAPAPPEALLQSLQLSLSQIKQPLVKILGPVPALMLKRQGQYHFQLLIQSLVRKPLHEMLDYAITFLEGSKLAKKVRWSLDVDPQDMY